jgi:hypothetical protein
MHMDRQTGRHYFPIHFMCLVQRMHKHFHIHISLSLSVPYESFSLLASSAGFLLGLLFDPENGSNVFLRNVGVSPNHTM